VAKGGRPYIQASSLGRNLRRKGWAERIGDSFMGRMQRSENESIAYEENRKEEDGKKGNKPFPRPGIRKRKLVKGLKKETG